MKIGDMIAPRKAFGDALVELGRINPGVVVLDADVGTSTQSILFREAFPERFFQCGIAEQNMFGMAAGMATLGLTPFASTFACFVARRAADQISISIAYPKLGVKINGSYGGIPTGKAGATHQAFEDMAFMRAIPNMTVIAPSDAVETRKAVFAAAAHPGPVYLRTARCDVPVIFGPDYEFEIGRSRILREGDDVAIIANDLMTPKALDAGRILEREGVSARVIHMPTIKPIDEAAIVGAAQTIGRIITVENHSVIGGLGGAVAEVLAEKSPARLVRLGVRDHFGESGDYEALFTKYGMNVDSIVAAAMEIAR
ncbi:MAG TPA: transketolase family protein [Candidatus Brocadiia bacterium]|nr:transketolase family protein [Candidatus Brocadiia bacterium]